MQNAIAAVVAAVAPGSAEISHIIAAEPSAVIIH